MKYFANRSAPALAATIIPEPMNINSMLIYSGDRYTKVDFIKTFNSKRRIVHILCVNKKHRIVHILCVVLVELTKVLLKSINNFTVLSR